jgi:hypothetical protein
MLLMFLYATLISIFFALLWREDRSARIRLGIIIFCSLFFGGIIVGWLMFPAPYK